MTSSTSLRIKGKIFDSILSQLDYFNLGLNRNTPAERFQIICCQLVKKRLIFFFRINLMVTILEAVGSTNNEKLAKIGRWKEMLLSKMFYYTSIEIAMRMCLFKSRTYLLINLVWRSSASSCPSHKTPFLLYLRIPK